METTPQRNADYPELYGFPQDTTTTAMLYWMGEDYVDFIVQGLIESLSRQDPDMRLLALECLRGPDFRSAVQQHSGLITEQTVSFRIRVLAHDSIQQLWQMAVKMDYVVEDLNTDEISVTLNCDIEHAELMPVQ